MAKRPEIRISGIARATLGAYSQKKTWPQSLWFLKEMRWETSKNRKTKKSLFLDLRRVYLDTEKNKSLADARDQTCSWVSSSRRIYATNMKPISNPGRRYDKENQKSRIDDFFLKNFVFALLDFCE